MENDKHTVRSTLTEVKEAHDRDSTASNWARLQMMTDDELEASIDWDEEGQYDWGEAYPGPSAATRPSTGIGLDPGIVAWFATRGNGGRARMATVLRDFVDARIRRTPGPLPRRQRRAG